MLKAVRVTSLFCTILTLFVVIMLTTAGLKESPEVQAFLEKQSILETIRNHVDNNGSHDGEISPLVAQAQLFAFRIEPPQIIIIEEKIQPPENKIADQGGIRSESIKPDIPIIPVTLPQPKFDLLATVHYESAPEKSLALFRSGDKQEWFRRGETVGRLEIKEIKNGRVLLTQSNQITREMLVSPKPQIKQLLKDG